MNRAEDALSAAISRRPRTRRRTAMHLELLEPRQLLSGGVPAGLDIGQANWFYQNTFAAPASVAPEWNGNVATGNAGSLGATYLAAIAARVNAYRWMAGLPGGVTLDATENAAAQQAALMMAANVQLSHSPPATWLDYTAAGALAAARSNLTLGASGTSAIDLDMTDSGDNNTFVGHRRWILYPPTRTMGVGDIPADSNVLYVVQPDSPAPAVTAVAWPPAGYVPAPLIPLRWSLQSAPGSDFSRATVAVSENGVSQTVEILSNDANGYGGDAIVWDLPFAPAPQPGQQVVYVVRVANILIDGQPQSFSYTTTSFDPRTTTDLTPVPAQVEFLQPTVQTSSSGSSVVIEVARSMNAGQHVTVAYSTSSGTAKAGTNYVSTSGTLTFAPGQFYSQIVVPILRGSSRNAGGTFSIAISSPVGASIGPVSVVQVSVNSAATEPYQPPIGTGGPTSEPIGTTPPIEVDVREIFQTIVVGRTRQSRHAIARFAGFQLTFNQPLDPSSATTQTNYSVLEYHRHSRALAVQSIPFRASYDASADKVRLILIGRHRFPQGGRLILRAMLTNPAGTLPAGNTVFTILPGATGVI